MKYYVIGDEDTVLGFGMVGVEGSVVEDRASAEQAFQQALDEHDVGILIINEKTADLIRPRVNRYLFSEKFPLILEIPDREGPKQGRSSIREMVNAAIGIKL
jgi:V/A-type H+-transporting ATPase subunit F